MMTLRSWSDEYRRSQGGRAAEVARAAAEGPAALADRLRAAGLPHGPADADELDRVAVLTKDALPQRQSGRAYADLLAPGAEVVRAYASPGPIYEPQLAGADPWRWAPALEACGIGRGDVVLNCFSYHLSPAGMMFDEACRAVGATVIPAGVGMQEVQARAVADLAVTAYIGLPSYLAALGETYDRLGLPSDRWRVRTALVTAEPLPAELRRRLRERVPVVLMAYGTAEVGLIAYEVEADAGLVPAPGTYVQVCDPESGRPLTDGESGEVVVSVLHADYPLLRFGTGDVSRWVSARDGAVLAGVLGRVGAAVKVRGMFVHPHQAGEVLAGLHDDGLRRGRFVVERHDGADVLRLEVVAAPGADPARLEEALVRRCRESLRVRPTVEVVGELGSDDVLVDLRG